MLQSTIMEENQLAIKSTVSFKPSGTFIMTRDYEFGISAIDSGFHRPLLDAVHMIVEKGRVALVDTGVNASIPLVEAALRAKGFGWDQVDAIILSHIHLDHAGGASQLMRLCPRATLYVHPRGSRHMADPSKLVAATYAVYGEEVAKRNYGQIVPIDPARIVETKAGYQLDFHGRAFEFYDTPGHAKHSASMRDTRSGHWFTGDTFGLGYTELRTDGRCYVFPTSSPTQFEPEALHASVNLIASHKPAACYLTHFGQVTDIARLADDLHRLIDAHVAMAKPLRHAGAGRNAALREGLRKIILDEKQRQGWDLSDEAVMQVFEIDAVLNADGLEPWLDSLPA
jgi:glyoxylase-like metal-dependent hydrolase (beta-lactamase superfamily II)